MQVSTGSPPLELRSTTCTLSSSGEQPPPRDREAAAATARTRLLDGWQAHLTAPEAVEAALRAAALRSAQLDVAAQERVLAARLCAYPLPRRITAPYARETAKALWRAVHAKKVAGDRVRASYLDSGTLAEAVRVDKSCGSLVRAAHAAGLIWLSARPGPGLAAGQAWCAEFLELCAGVRGARVLLDGHVEAALEREAGMDDAVEGIYAVQSGGGCGPHPFMTVSVSAL